MPRLDGTGPNGEGPMTGRGRGDCQNRKPCCRRNNGTCRQEEYSRQDYLTEKEVLEKRLKEINEELSKDGE